MKEKLGFEIRKTDWAVYSQYNPKTKVWGDLVAVSPDNRDVWPSPRSAAVNYGLGAIEGMKAFRHKDGSVHIFRIVDHSIRFAQTLKGIIVPEFPPAKFMDAVMALVRLNEKFVPEYRKGSLYIRPIMFAGDQIGFAYNPETPYTVYFWCTPVGGFLSDSFDEAIKLYVCREITRATPGGTGPYKASVNYLPARRANALANQKGCKDALFIDCNGLHIQEIGGANIFIVKDDALYTPKLRDTILSGITRRSIFRIAGEIMGLPVYDSFDVTVNELLTADEVFASGTAAVITPIGEILDRDKWHKIGDGKPGKITKELYNIYAGIQHGGKEDIFGWLTEV